MGFYNGDNTSVNAILTTLGRKYLSTEGRVNITRFQLSDEEIDYFVKNQAVPKSIKKPEPDDVYDPLFGKKKILFHRKSSKAEVNIFEGGHEHVSAVALTWLSKQVK